MNKLAASSLRGLIVSPPNASSALLIGSSSCLNNCDKKSSNKFKMPWSCSLNISIKASFKSTLIGLLLYLFILSEVLLNFSLTVLSIIILLFKSLSWLPMSSISAYNLSNSFLAWMLCAISIVVSLGKLTGSIPRILWMIFSTRCETVSDIGASSPSSITSTDLPASNS